MSRLGWVLVTDGTSGQNRSSLAAVQALGMAGYQAAVTVSGRSSRASASRFCERVVPVPPVDDWGYAEAVRAALEAHSYVAVLPTSDAAMYALGLPGRHLLDKEALAALAAQAGLDTPPGRTFEDARSLSLGADDIDYPCVVKPVCRTGSRPVSARRFDTAERLRKDLDLPGRLLVQPIVPDGMHAVTGVMWRGELKAVVHQQHVRIWPRDCGDACYAVTTAPDPVLEKRLQALLADYDGIFQAEFAGRYLVDLNPRVYGSLPLAGAAGADLVRIWCDLLRGVDIEQVRGRPGVEYHWWEGDARHLVSRWRSDEASLREAARALQLGKAFQGNLALRDPKPSLLRGRHLGGALVAHVRNKCRLARPGDNLRSPSGSEPAGG